MRLLIVSNRLPVAVSRQENKYILKKSAGGLVSGLTDYLNSMQKSKSMIDDYLWMGWPGMSIKKEDEDLIREKVKEVFKAVPVFISQNLMDKVYLGFCNKTIWPLFHYFLNYTKHDPQFWQLYKKFNRIFCDEIVKAIKPDDFIWIHDYHLMLLPAMLRESVPNPVGFFLHIPFPSFEVFRTLQKDAKKEILEGLLGADLVGFHTHDYAQYFLRCVLRILGLESHIGEITYKDRVVKVNTYPMGIDYEKFNGMDVTPHHSEKPKPEEIKIVLSVDRLDYTKGIVNRLLGFQLFLKQNPQWHGKVYMNMIVVPSRTGVPSYQRIKRRLDELVGNINGSYGNIDWTPIVYQYTSLPHKELIAQYRRSNVSLLTPLRDGMNLVAKEYVASLKDKKGALILSEFTGAAKELGESIIINPYNIGEIAESIKEALELPEDEQERRNSVMQERLKRYNIQYWANDFVETLQVMNELALKSLKRKRFTDEIKNKLLQDYRSAQQRIIICNYDRILVPYGKDYKDIEPTEELTNILKQLSEFENTDLVVNSSRSAEDMDRYLGSLPVNMTAEHGTWIRESGENEWTLLKPISPEWKEEILPILELYTDRLPGSMLEEKESSVAWYYHKADIEQATFISNELADNLIAITSNMDLQVDHGIKVIEVYHEGIDKSEIVKHFIDKKTYDFILVLGDNWTDELLFQTLPTPSYSINVGNIHTDADYMIKNQVEALKLLEELKEES